MKMSTKIIKINKGDTFNFSILAQELSILNTKCLLADNEAVYFRWL